MDKPVLINIIYSLLVIVVTLNVSLIPLLIGWKKAVSKNSVLQTKIEGLKPFQAKELMEQIKAFKEGLALQKVIIGKLKTKNKKYEDAEEEEEYYNNVIMVKKAEKYEQSLKELEINNEIMQKNLDGFKEIQTDNGSIYINSSII